MDPGAGCAERFHRPEPFRSDSSFAGFSLFQAGAGRGFAAVLPVSHPAKEGVLDGAGQYDDDGDAGEKQFAHESAVCRFFRVFGDSRFFVYRCRCRFGTVAVSGGFSGFCRRCFTGRRFLVGHVDGGGFVGIDPVERPDGFFMTFFGGFFQQGNGLTRFSGPIELQALRQVVGADGARGGDRGDGQRKKNTEYERQ